MLTWADVLEVAGELPEVEETTSYGRPTLTVRRKFVAALRARPDAIVLKCDPDEKPYLLEARSDVLFETPHYHGWPAMLLRLEASTDDLREFLVDSWLLAAPKRLVDAFAPPDT